MARAAEANEAHSRQLITMHVVRRRPVRTGELNDELHLASCGVALDPFDHRERAVVMDDVRLVHGVRAVLISEAVAAAALASGITGKTTATNRHTTLALVAVRNLFQTLSMSRLHLLKMLQRGRPVGYLWQSGLQLGQVGVRRFKGILGQCGFELFQFLAGGHRLLTSVSRGVTVSAPSHRTQNHRESLPPGFRTPAAPQISNCAGPAPA